MGAFLKFYILKPQSKRILPNLAAALLIVAAQCACAFASSAQKPAWESANKLGANNAVANAQQSTSLLKATDFNKKRIDASTQQKLHDTFAEVLMSLNDHDQQMFAAAMATIGVIVAEDKSEDTQKKLYDIVHNKTAEEIIAASRKLTPHIRKYSKIIDGTNEDTFNRSIGRIVISLPLEMQGKFSEAIAKLMYQAQKDKIPPKQLYKKLDAKTPDEVIWMAEHVNMPFSIVNSSSPNAPLTTLSPITKEEAEKYKKTLGKDGLIENPPKPADIPSLNTDLSPSSLFKGQKN